MNPTPDTAKHLSPADARQLTDKIKTWAQELGFQACGISNTDLSLAETKLIDWLNRGYHGSMQYMQRHGTLRSRPQELVSGTLSIVSVRMEYFPADTADEWETLQNTTKAYISRYALGRDYHKVMRRRLQKLAHKVQEEIGAFGYRAFVDSAPVLETAIATKANLGWEGKHTLLINQAAGSWFFLGELFTDLPLVEDAAAKNHCGSCTSCIDICPTQAIVAPYTVDARRCISYLTIEQDGPIPHEFRQAMGNRIYGCDDCQLVCPWNRFSNTTQLDDYQVRHSLDDIHLVELAYWTQEEFLSRMEGSPIRRIGHEKWLRNIAVALGNAEGDIQSTVKALQHLRKTSTELVKEHTDWALEQHQKLIFGEILHHGFIAVNQGIGRCIVSRNGALRLQLWKNTSGQYLTQFHSPLIV